MTFEGFQRATRLPSAGRWRFALYIFAPFVVFFFVPLVFYRIPLRVPLWDRAVYVGGHDVLVAVAVCLAWAGVATGMIVWPSKQPATPRAWTSQALWRAFLIMSTLGVLVSFVHSLYVMPHGLEEIVHVAAFAPTVGFVLGLYVLRDLRRGPFPMATRTLITALLILDLGSSLLIPILQSKMMPAAASMLAILYGVGAMGLSVRRQLLVGLLLVPVLLAAFPSKAILREVVFRGPYIRAPLGANVLPSINSEIHQAAGGTESFVKAVPPGFDLWTYGFRFHRLGPRVPAFWEYAVWRALNRINRLSDLVYVIEMTPASIPYSQGSTYAPLIWKLVPSILWKDRPREEAGQLYGHRYDFIIPSDLAGSFNLPMVTEGWMNWGWLGVILSAAFVGMVLRLIWWHWIGESGAPGNVIIGMAVVGTAAVMESNLSLVMGGVIHAFLFYWLVEVLFRARGHRMAPQLRSVPSQGPPV